MTAAFHRRRTEPISSLLGLDVNTAPSSSASRRRTAHPTGQGSDGRDRRESGSFPRPSKKARLCEDAVNGPIPSSETERSKFFPAGKTKAPKPKRSEPILMSDDSVEEALLSLPDVDDWNPMQARSRKSMEIFQDTPQRDEAPVSEEQPVPKDDDIVPESDDEEAPSRPRGDEGGRRNADVPTASMRATLQQFSYTPNVVGTAPAHGTRMVNGLPTPASSEPGSGVQQQRRTDKHMAASGTPLLTPLQRIGAEALKRGRGAQRWSVPPDTPTLLSSPQKGTLSQNQTRKRKSAVRQSFPANPSFVPLPKVDLEEVEALNRPLGSEDQIVPDSDGENDEPERAGDDGEEPRAPRLNLSRFLHS